MLILDNVNLSVNNLMKHSFGKVKCISSLPMCNITLKGQKNATPTLLAEQCLLLFNDLVLMKRRATDLQFVINCLQADI